MVKTFEIRYWGRVQGVGFRPFVYRAAILHGLKGFVQNNTSGVRIVITCSEEHANTFQVYLQNNLPAAAVVTGTKRVEIAIQPFDDFTIQESKIENDLRLLLSPDYGMCANCLQDIQNKTNRRYQYAFTTCTDCGPRYSIVTGLPYDRPQTTMEPFKMCRKCLREYHDPLNRRYFSQTNCCPDCGPSLEILKGQNNGLSLYHDLVRELRDEKIIAIKGIGGFLLVTDATNPAAVMKLRKRKNRPSKPFAVLYPNIDMLREDAIVSESEEGLLTSLEAPILILSLRHNPKSKLAVKEINPAAHTIGAMLPYSPLLFWVAHAFQGPLVATSGNVSGSPIIYQDEEATRTFQGIADKIITYNRQIVIPQDDSVMRLSPRTQTPVILRRSRGLAPALMVQTPSLQEKCILAMGADLKGAIGVVFQGQYIISQYLGALDNLLTQQSLMETYRLWQNLYRFNPEEIIGDLHPDYFSHRIGKKIAKELSISFTPIQHHKAHFAAILGEHQLWKFEKPILGVIWDGTGYGEDGQIWGGEFFIYKNNQIKRAYHLKYISTMSGDLFARQPRLALFSYGHNLEKISPILRKKFNDIEWQNYQRIFQKSNIKTSSMGRLFDAVSSLLDICDHHTYEGEAALLLEQKALEYYMKKEDSNHPSYSFDISEKKEIDCQPMVSDILHDYLKHEDTSLIAYKFHLTLTHMVKSIAALTGIKTIACSGGVFQNALLLDLLKDEMGDNYDLYFHRHLSPNDENISYGQLEYRLNLG